MAKHQTCPGHVVCDKMLMYNGVRPRDDGTAPRHPDAM
jgi:hypothetical protein